MITLILDKDKILIKSYSGMNWKPSDFKRDLSKVPSREKLEAQEPIARKEYKKAIDNEKKGKDRSAINIHKTIVKKYTFTTGRGHQVRLVR